MERKQADANSEELVVALVSVRPWYCAMGRGRGDSAVGRRVGLLTRVQEGLCRMSRVAIQPCDIHRRPLLCWDTDLQAICTIKSWIRMCVYEYVGQ